MKNPFELFKHPKFGEIRVILLNDEPFKPWFVAVDVCRALEIKNPTMALERLEDDEKMTLSLSEMTLSSTEGHSSKRGGARFLNIINEPGFYRLVFASRKKEALEFQRWVYHEVLPSIRKTGSYSLTNEITPAVVKKIDLARVYLLRLSDGTVLIVKIGYSKNIRARVAKIKRETGLKVVDMYFTPEMPRKDARLIEWAIQEKLSSRRVKGEFFSVDFDEARNVVDYFVEITLATLPNQSANFIADN